jgi:mersacidin/lichenicidin family type 2 lantibiotic
MQEIDKIIRAWKDDDYLMSLNADERLVLPNNPAGLVQYSGTDLDLVNGSLCSTTIVAFTLCSFFCLGPQK